MDFLLMRSKNFEDSTRAGVLTGAGLAQEKNLGVMLIVPQIQSLKSPILEGAVDEAFGEGVFKALVKNRSIQMLGGKFLTVGLARDVTSLRRFNGVVIGVWATPNDANIITSNTPFASSIILTEWGMGNLAEWAKTYKAKVIGCDKKNEQS